MDYIEAATRVTEAFLNKVDLDYVIGEFKSGDSKHSGSKLGELYASTYLAIVNGVNETPAGGNGKPPRQTQVNRY